MPISRNPKQRATQIAQLRPNLEALGVTPLLENEDTDAFRVRAAPDILQRFKEMSTAERGAFLTRAFELSDTQDQK